MTLIDFKIIGKPNEGSNARTTLWGAGAWSAENFLISNVRNSHFLRFNGEIHAKRNKKNA